MPKYLVTAFATISLERTIEAESPEDAKDECKADWDLHLDLVGDIEDLKVEELTDA